MGKSVLLSMIAKSTEADVVVIGLIGERGRELTSFTTQVLGSHSRDKVVSLRCQPIDRRYYVFRVPNALQPLPSTSEMKVKTFF